MEKIVFFNTKGGTGKTTICFNYGWYLAKNFNKKILFLDFDPQVSLVQALFKKVVIPKNKCLENLIVSSLENNDIDFNEYILKAAKNIDVLPSSNNISLLEEFLTEHLIEKSRQTDDVFHAWHRNLIIKNTLEKYLDKSDYDYVIIDSQPNYSLLSTTSLIFAKKIVIVLKPEIFSFLDIAYLKRIISNLEKKYHMSLNIVAVLINAYEKRKRASESVYEKFKHRYGTEFNLVSKKIRYLSHYQLSIMLNNEPVFKTFPFSEASLDMLDAFGEIDSFLSEINKEKIFLASEKN